MDRETVIEFLESHKWTFAKTMPWNPHFWIVKDKSRNVQEFEDVAEWIQKNGEPYWFFKTIYKCFYYNGFRYWTMGNPPKETTIINRAENKWDGVRHDYYDEIADVYQTLYITPEYINENREIVGQIDIKGRVLDIGCGDGLLLDYATISPEQYTGIDPSKGMLKYFNLKHPGFNAYPIPFENFHDKGFDTIISLFGAPSYINPYSVQYIKKMLRRGGSAFLMFYKDGYDPVTHIKTGLTMKIYDNNIPGDEWHNYKIVRWIN